MITTGGTFFRSTLILGIDPTFQVEFLISDQHKTILMTYSLLSGKLVDRVREITVLNYESSIKRLM